MVVPMCRTFLYSSAQNISVLISNYKLIYLYENILLLFSFNVLVIRIITENTLPTFFLFFDLGHPIKNMRASIGTRTISDISQIPVPPVQELLSTSYYDV